jgi:hypothetical protein
MGEGFVPDPARLLEVALIAWLAAIAAIVGYRLLTGGITTDGLLSTRGGGVDPERVQMLMGAIAGAIYYANDSLSLLGTENIRHLPDPSTLVLSLLGGSQLLYLGGKFARNFRNLFPSRRNS